MFNRQLRENLQSKGFTLIELLVVIAIISLLVSILLPSLNRAKELAKRVVCASNLHNVAMAYSFYASEYDDCLPVGYMSAKQFNYVVWGWDEFPLFGCLYLADLMAAPEVFYCPTNEQDVGTCFNSDINPWPPGDPGDYLTRAGYSSRPEVEWVDADTPVSFPRLDDLSTQAIVADILSVPVHLQQRHKDGVNVGYGDGSASWLEAGKFDETLDLIDNSYLEMFDDEIAEIWDIFDEQH